MLKLKLSNVELFLLEIYIVISFFAFRNSTLESIYLIALMALFLIGRSNRSSKTRFSRDIVFCLLLVAICFLLSCFFCKYKQHYTIGVFICICLLEMLAENGVFSLIEKAKPDLFFIAMIMAFSWLLYRSFQQGIFKVRTLMGDQNYTGIMVFCIFLYSMKRKYVFGLVFTAMYAIVFNNSRGFISLLLVFALFWVIKKPVYRIVSWKDRKARNLFLLFIISTVFSILLSLFWIYRVSAAGFTTVYKGSINDASNRIRALSILRGVQMLGNPRETLLWGYGTKLLEVMGISGTDFSTHPRFMGLRLAQAHNTAINLADRTGIVPAVLYYYVLSKVLSRYITEENIPYFFPFFLNSLFMHSLLVLQWLVLFVIVLSIPQQKWKIKRIIIKTRKKETVREPIPLYGKESE